MTAPAGSSRFPLAYIAGKFPVRSETFVYREVRELRRRGWPVVAVSLHRPAPTEDHDLEQNRLIVYGSERAQTLTSAGAEILQHPLSSFKTLATSLKDAAFPGEPLPWSARLKLPLQAVAAIGLAHWLRGRDVQHIHCHFAHAATTVGMYAAMQLKIPFSFTGHANDLFQRRSILKTKLRRAAFVACISRWHQAWYSQIQPDTEGKYEVIRCGVDAGQSIGKPGDAQWGDAQPANAQGALRILTVARLVEKKGIDMLIAAMAELNKRGIKARLTIAGDGSDRGRLDKITADLNCGDQIVWLGAVDNSRVFSLLGEADVFALPSRQDSNGDKDGIPVVLMEAMAGGIPVIAGDLPTIRELVEDGVSGLLVEANQSAALADKLAMLWKNPELRQRLADEGKKKVESEFSLPANVDRLERRFAAAGKK